LLTPSAEATSAILTAATPPRLDLLDGGPQQISAPLSHTQPDSRHAVTLSPGVL
jgi:hypothetical protein